MRAILRTPPDILAPCGGSTCLPTRYGRHHQRTRRDTAKPDAAIEPATWMTPPAHTAVPTRQSAMTADSRRTWGIGGLDFTL